MTDAIGVPYLFKFFLLVKKVLTDAIGVLYPFGAKMVQTDAVGAWYLFLVFFSGEKKSG